MNDAPRRTIPLHIRILLGLFAGAILGGLLNWLFDPEHPIVKNIVDQFTEPIGQIFLRLLLLLVIPLVFSSLTLGVAGLGDVRKIGRIGLKCLLYTLIISAVSVLIGLLLANTIRPGKRIDADVRQQLENRYGSDAQKRLEATKAAAPAEAPLMKVVKAIIPTNVFTAVSKETPDMLGLMFFAIFFGIALTLVEAQKSRGVLAVLEGIYEAVAKCIEIVMLFAPYAVFCLLFTMTARFGFKLLTSLGWFVATVLLGLGIHMFIVYSASVAVLSRISPLEFFRRIKTVMITAFSTSSSNATLPTAMRVSEENLGVPREINSFVLTIGATANQNGTALYEGVTVLFLAQLAGVDLSVGQQLVVCYLAILGGIGTAGVPSGSIPFVIVILSTIGVNPALIAIIIGVDRILDMCRTVLNVTGDLTMATYIARSEGAPLLVEKPMPPELDL